MSRSGYSDDCDYLDLYRGTVERALHGKRGQTFLRELASALDSLPERKLITGQLIDERGACCAIGSVCKTRGLDVSGVDYTDPESIGKMFNISSSMAAEIAYMNDEWETPRETPEDRWKRMRGWVNEHLASKVAES